MLFVHSLLTGIRGSLGVASLVLSVALSVGLVGFLFFSEAYVLLTAFAFVGISLVGSKALSSQIGQSFAAPLSMTLLWLSACILAVSLTGSFTWIAAGAGGAYPIQLGAWNASMATLEILGLLSPAVPALVLVLLFVWVLRPIVPKALRTRAWGRDQESSPTAAQSKGSDRWPAVLLVLATATAIYVRAFAYLPAINPSSLRVGTDAIRGYACWLGLSPQGIPFNECDWYWWSLHIGALWVLQGINYLTSSPGLTMKLAPAIWGIFFDLATYILVKEGTGDSLLAGVSALFSAVSLQTVVGVDAGILANWLALPVAFLFFAAMLKMSRTRKKLYLLPAVFLFISLLFIHPWTWFLMAVIFATYLALELLQRFRSHELGKTRLEAGILLSMVLMAAAAVAAEGVLSPNNWLYVGFQTAISSINLSNIVNVVPNLQSSLTAWVGGGETNPVWWILGALGVLAIPSVKDRFAKLLIVWVASISLVIPLLNAPSLMQERVLFDLPLPILAAIGAFWLGNHLRDSLPEGSLWHWRGYNIPLFLVVATATLLSLGFDLEYIGFLFRL
ncbi:MAG: hypothetical protein JRM74_04860 [Nitrososphaerota archaeon]|nr:hypothetical protein [Nitrososphaerota archaeon]